MKSLIITSGVIFPGTILFGFNLPSYAYETINLERHLLNYPTKKTTQSVCCSLVTSHLIAQITDDNRDRFLQPDLQPLPPEPEETEPILPKPEKPPFIPPSEAEDANIEIPVTKIKITGSTVFTAAELQAITKPLEGRSVTLKELREATQTITRKYLARGYLTSRAILPEQEIQDGIVTIRIIEGSIADIQIDGNNRVSDRFIRQRLELGADTPVRVDNIEGQLQLLKTNALFDNLEANLQPAAGEGESSLVVEVDEAKPFFFGLNLDNSENVNTGAERAGITLGYLNLIGSGDSITTSFNHSLDADSWSLDANYSIPVNAKDGTLQLRTNIERNEIISDFEELDIEGESELYEVSFRQPLIRSLREEFALSLGFSHQDSSNFINGVSLTEPNRTSVIKFGQDYTSREPKGVWALRSQFNLGVDIFDATVSDDDQADGIFFSWLGQAQRLQRLNPNNLLIIQADLQFTPDELLPSEQFVIGGLQSVRGYRQNARLGDNGFRLSVEDRITVLRSKDRDNRAVLQLAPFTDLGVVWNNSAADPDDNFLAGIGLGILVQPVPNLNIRLDYAPPLVDIEDIGDNIQEDGFYFSINYRY